MELKWSYKPVEVYTLEVRKKKLKNKFLSEFCLQVSTKNLRSEPSKALFTKTN